VVKQERAQQTRRELVDSAAAEFDRHGYAGTALARVVESAGTTMGALTFHFPTKHRLAEAVCGEGAETVRAALTRRPDTEPPGLQGVIDLTHALARLLEEEVVVRAAARLGRERRETAATWYAAWGPALQECLDHAQKADLPVSDTVRQAVAALVGHLVAGSEATQRANAAGAHRPAAREQLRWIWELVLTGALSAPKVQHLNPRGSDAAFGQAE